MPSVTVNHQHSLQTHVFRLFCHITLLSSSFSLSLTQTLNKYSVLKENCTCLYWNMCDVVPDSDGCLRNYSLYAVLTSQEDIVGALAMTFHRSKPFHQSQTLAPKHNRARVLFLFFSPHSPFSSGVQCPVNEKTNIVVETTISGLELPDCSAAIRKCWVPTEAWLS